MSLEREPATITSDPRPTGEKTRHSGDIINPYLLGARTQWNVVWGEFISTTDRARLRERMAWGIAFLAVTALLINVWHPHRPFVVVVDQEGHTLASGIADRSVAVSDRLKASVLMDWIANLRLVTSDGALQREAINNVYGKIDSASPAREFINDFYRASPPQQRAQSQTVHVDVKSALPVSKDTYEIEWVETTRDLQGKVQSETRWRGAFTIVVSPPEDERVGRMNPLGIYVTHVSW